MKLTKRQTKGIKLTIEEMDENLDYLNAQASVWENDIDDRIRPKNGKLVRREFIDGIDVVETVVETTHAELVALRDASELTVGQKYLITDFAQAYNVFDGGGIGEMGNTEPPFLIEEQVGTLEPLIVTAISETELDKVAMSPLYPKDIIYYSLGLLHDTDIGFGDGNGNPTVNFKGQIYFRHDTVQDNSLWYDFRNVKFRRWGAADGYKACTQGDYESTDYQDILTFGDVENYGNVKGNHIGLIDVFRFYTILNNTIFNAYSKCVSNIIVIDCFNNTVGFAFFNNTVGDGFMNNIVENGFNSNTVGDNFMSNTVGDNFYNNTVGDNFNSNIVGKMFNTNTVGDDFTNNTVGDKFMNNYIHSITVAGVDFTTLPLPTHIYSDRHCTIYKDAIDGTKLSYMSGGVLTIADVTA